MIASNNILFYVAPFLLISLSFGMELTVGNKESHKKIETFKEFCLNRVKIKTAIDDTPSQESLNEYSKIVKPFKYYSIKTEKVDKIYEYLTSFLEKKSNQHRQYFLNSPLPKMNGKTIAHCIARISHKKDLDFKKFWNLLFNNNIQINELHDHDYNTILMDAFYHYTDKEDKTEILWNPATILFLMHFHASPLIPNNKGETPKNIILELISDEEWLKDYTNQMYANLLKNACYLYEYK